MLDILQIFLLFLTTFLSQIGTTNPNFSSASDYVPNEGIGASLMTFVAPKVGHFLTWASTLYQTLYLLLQNFAPSLTSTFFIGSPFFIDPLPFTLTAALGFFFMTIGGLGRIWCHKVLGRYFTFELVIRNDHKLIKTGPYAYARHPAYTFSVFLVTGIWVVHGRVINFFPNITWIRAIFNPTGLAAFCFVVGYPLVRRVILEERALAKRFGKEWDEYASKTKMFIPKIF